MQSIADCRSDVDDVEESFMAEVMARCIRVAGSAASSTRLEAFLISPTPIMTGTAWIGAMIGEEGDLEGIKFFKINGK